ncbi:hypothetical protein GCM10023084_71770 [Streptomyces lacrimifluminis]|uniref:Uncharacterized protein n=1 Tax=Streptomyces lacrimifluminis TaxID=1500077 RepID=A0A917P7Z3_9ACTN|nr:hypothetical protein GCM10012282_73960 [Streptomyces lacrimifluminis]
MPLGTLLPGMFPNARNGCARPHCAQTDLAGGGVQSGQRAETAPAGTMRACAIPTTGMRPPPQLAGLLRAVEPGWHPQLLTHVPDYRVKEDLKEKFGTARIRIALTPAARHPRRRPLSPQPSSSPPPPASSAEPRKRWSPKIPRGQGTQLGETAYDCCRRVVRPHHDRQWVVHCRPHGHG